MPLSLEELDAFPPNRGFDGNVIPYQSNFVLESNLNEVFDVYCVMKLKKPLAGLDWSDYGRQKYRRMNIPLINQVMSMAHHHGVKWIQYRCRGGIYLNTIFYMSDHEQHAIALTKLIWDEKCEFSPTYKQVAIGLLLGYDKSNIEGFIKYNGYEVSQPDIQLVEQQLNTWVKTLSPRDLPSRAQIQTRPIPLL